MSKINVFLADLEHNYRGSPQNAMPYSVGLVASYAKKIHGDKVNIRLFKYPEKLYEALTKEGCDILGCSTYIWNSNLSHWACRVAKKKNPNTLTVLGGPDFYKTNDLRIEYFKKYKYIDMRVAHEGEVSFSNILKVVLENGIQNRDKIFSDKINGCIYLNRKTNELIEAKQERLHSLGLIPSPYTTGLLDEFFDGHLSPSLQTHRGCPFKCNFCHESDDYFAKVKFLETQYVLDDIEYIAKKMHETKNVAYLFIADSNFGMHTRDRTISEKILEVQKKYGWPQDVNLTIGKNERIIDTTSILKDMFEFTMSVQSMNQTVLDATGRTNLPKATYKRMAEYLRKNQRSSLAETICPLPEETLSSFFDGMRELMDMKVQRIISNTLMLLRGTIYEDKKYLDKYGYKTKFRLLPTQFGIYGGEKIFEWEEVGISTNSMSRDDYIETRKFIFLIEVLYNSKIFRELEFLIEDYNLSYYDFIFYVYKNIKNFPKDVKDVMESVIKLSFSELKDTEEEGTKYYSDDKNFKKIEDGEEGNNLKFVHKALLMSRYQESWLKFVFSSLKEFLEKNNVEIEEDYHDVITFTKCKYDKILDLKNHETIDSLFTYDVINWINQKDRVKPLKEFTKKDKVKIKFIYNKYQIAKREYLFKKFKDNTKLNLANIIYRFKPQHKILRNYEYVEPISYSS